MPFCPGKKSKRREVGKSESEYTGNPVYVHLGRVYGHRSRVYGHLKRVTSTQLQKPGLLLATRVHVLYVRLNLAYAGLGPVFACLYSTLFISTQHARTQVGCTYIYLGRLYAYSKTPISSLSSANIHVHACVQWLLSSCTVSPIFQKARGRAAVEESKQIDSTAEPAARSQRRGRQTDRIHEEMPEHIRHEDTRRTPMPRNCLRSG